MSTKRKQNFVYVVTYDDAVLTVCSTRKLAESLLTKKEAERFSIIQCDLDSIFLAKPEKYHFYVVNLRYTGTVIDAYQLSGMYWTSEFWMGHPNYAEFRVWEDSRKSAIKRAQENFHYIKNRKEGDSDYWKDKRGGRPFNGFPEIIYSIAEHKTKKFLPV